MKTRPLVKTFFCFWTCLAFSLTAWSGPSQSPVTVTLGPKAYHDGDVIRIDEVLATSPHPEPGDTVTVKGHYRLDSRGSARLCFFLTQTEGKGTEEVESSQRAVVKRGFHPFEVSLTVKHRGFLHLTFYDTETGKPFGGTYFGTNEQMAGAASISVAHYLAAE